MRVDDDSIFIGRTSFPPYNQIQSRCSNQDDCVKSFRFEMRGKNIEERSRPEAQMYSDIGWICCCPQLSISSSLPIFIFSVHVEEKTRTVSSNESPACRLVLICGTKGRERHQVQDNLHKNKCQGASSRANTALDSKQQSTFTNHNQHDLIGFIALRAVIVKQIADKRTIRQDRRMSTTSMI